MPINPSEIEVRHLRYFLAVAEELHFGRAAERLQIAQPSLSQQIRRLERAIGTDLFSRARRRVALTTAGEALLDGAVATLRELDGAVDAVRDVSLGITGHLTIGFIEAAALRIVPEAIRRFSAARPRVGLTLRELGVEDQIEGLLSGRLDLGFVRSRPGVEGLISEVVLEEGLVAAVPAGHRLAGRSSLSAEVAFGEPLVAVERSVLPGLYVQTTELLQDYGGGPGIAQVATSVLAVLGLVAADLGIALLPDSVRDISLPGVVFIEIDRSPTAPIVVVRPSANGSGLIEPFLDAVRMGFEEPGPEGSRVE